LARALVVAVEQRRGTPFCPRSADSSSPIAIAPGTPADYR
jgi:hypothetical protein